MRGDRNDLSRVKSLVLFSVFSVSTFEDVVLDVMGSHCQEGILDQQHFGVSENLALGGDAMVLRNEEHFPVSPSALRATAPGNGAGAGARIPGRLPCMLRPALFSLMGQRRKSFHERKTR